MCYHGISSGDVILTLPIVRGKKRICILKNSSEKRLLPKVN